MALVVGGTTVTGTQTLDATKLTGNLPALNASSLTNLDAADLTGTLPAINGASLTNLPSSTDANDSVGSYGSFRRWGADAANNSTTAASNLEWASTTGPNYSEGNPSGTWRIHGISRSGSANSGASTCCIWIRTA